MYYFSYLILKDYIADGKLVFSGTTPLPNISAVDPKLVIKSLLFFLNFNELADFAEQKTLSGGIRQFMELKLLSIHQMVNGLIIAKAQDLSSFG